MPRGFLRCPAAAAQLRQPSYSHTCTSQAFLQNESVSASKSHWEVADLNLPSSGSHHRNNSTSDQQVELRKHFRQENALMQHRSSITLRTAGLLGRTMTVAFSHDVCTAHLIQRRCISDRSGQTAGDNVNPLESADSLLLPDDANSSAATAPSTTPVSPRRFAHSRKPAKRVILSTAADSGIGESTTTQDSTAHHVDDNSQHVGNVRQTAAAAALQGATATGKQDATMHGSHEATSTTTSHKNPTVSKWKPYTHTAASPTSSSLPSSSVSPGSASQQRMELPTSRKYFYDARVAAPPDVATATPEMLDSYLQTMRRLLAGSFGKEKPLHSRARRAALYMLEVTMPLAMMDPPGGTSPAVPRTPTAAGRDELKRNSDAPSPRQHLRDSDAEDKSTNLRQDSTEGGKAEGRIPWTPALAESVLLTVTALHGRPKLRWVQLAALQVLLHDAAQSPIIPGQTRNTTKGDDNGGRVSVCDDRACAVPPVPPLLSDTALQQACSKARLAIGMLQMQYEVKRAEALLCETLRPLAARRAKKLFHRRRSAIDDDDDDDGEEAIGSAAARMPHADAAASHAEEEEEGTESATSHSSVTASPKASVGDAMTAMLLLQRRKVSTTLSIATVDRYLYAHLIPALMAQLHAFCGMLEARYDAAVEAEAAKQSVKPSPSPSAEENLASSPLQHRLLPSVSHAEIDAFAALLSVLYRVVGLHGVVVVSEDENGDAGKTSNRSRENSASDRGSFLFQPHELYGDDPQAAAQLYQKRQTQLSLRAYTIAVAAVANTLHRSVGAHTGRLEAILELHSRNTRNRDVAVFDDGAPADDGAAAEATSDDTKAVSSPPLDSARSRTSTKSTRFQQRATQTTSARDGRGKSASTVSTSQGHERNLTLAQKGTQRARSSASAASFNLQPLDALLRFCFHSHTMTLFVRNDDSQRRGTIAAAATDAERMTTMTTAAKATTAGGYVQEIAAAHFVLLRLGIHWAPLFRTSQLSSVVRAVSAATASSAPSSRVTSVVGSDASVTVGSTSTANLMTAEIRGTGTSTPGNDREGLAAERNAVEAPFTGARAAAEEKKSEAASVYPPLSVAVQRQLRTQLLHAYPTGSAFLKVPRRLLQSTTRYVGKYTGSSFTSTATALARLFAQSPQEYYPPLTYTSRGSGECNAPKSRNLSGGPARVADGRLLCFPLPPAAATEVLLFSDFLESQWLRCITQLLQRGVRYSTLHNRPLHDSSVGVQALLHARTRATIVVSLDAEKADADDIPSVQRQRIAGSAERDAAAAEESISSPSAFPVAENGHDAATGSNAASSIALHLSAPPFALTWMSGVRHDSACIDPASMLSLLRATDAAAAFLAMPNSGARGTAVVAMLREWYEGLKADNALSGSESAGIVSRLLRLSTASQRLPALLMRDGVQRAWAEGGAAGSAPTNANLNAALTTTTAAAADAIFACTPSLQHLVVRQPPRYQTVHWMYRVNPLSLRLCSDGFLRAAAVGPSVRHSTRAGLPQARIEGAPSLLSANSAPAAVCSNARDSSDAALSSDERRTSWYVAKALYPQHVWSSTWQSHLFSTVEVTELLRGWCWEWLVERDSARVASAAVRSPPSLNTEVGRQAKKDAVEQHSSSARGGEGYDVDANGVRRNPDGTLHGFQLWLPQFSDLQQRVLLMRVAQRFLFYPLEAEEPSRCVDQRVVNTPTSTEPRDDRASFQAASSSARDAAKASPLKICDPRSLSAEVLFNSDASVPTELLVVLFLTTSAARHQDTLTFLFDVNFRDNALSLAQVGDRLVVTEAQEAASPPSDGLHNYQNCPLALRCTMLHCERVLQERLDSILRNVETGIATGGPAVKGREETAEKVAGLASCAEALLQLSILIEQAFPNVDAHENVTSKSTSAAHHRNDLPRQLRCVYEGALRAQLQEWSLRDIAALLSNELWWTTQRQAAAAAANVAADDNPSWVENALLDAVEDKLSERAAAAAAAAREVSEGPTKTPPQRGVYTAVAFESYEWALMPLYAKLEQRQRARETAAAARDAQQKSSTADATPTQLSPVFDDFTSLEDAFMDNSAVASLHASTAASGSASTLWTSSLTLSAPLSSAITVHSVALLESALSNLVTHCTSMSAFLHVIRHLFLTHPVLLSTSPDTAAQLNASGAALVGRLHATAPHNRTASSPHAQLAEQLTLRYAGSLPVQWGDLPQGLRTRYVETLFRLFQRLLHLHNTGLEDVVEVLHVLWLADAQLSRPNLTPADAPERRVSNNNAVGQPAAAPRLHPRSGTSSAAVASAEAWPSLFVLCADCIVEALQAEDSSEVPLAEQRDSSAPWENATSPDGPSRGGSAAAAAVVVPPVICCLRSVLTDGVLQTLYLCTMDSARYNSASLALRPATVLRFLQSLIEQVRAERALNGIDGPEAGTLSAAQQALMDLLTPFVLCLVEVVEVVVDADKATLVVALVDMLSEVDPALIITVIQSAFTRRQNNSTGSSQSRRGSPPPRSLDGKRIKKQKNLSSRARWDAHVETLAALMTAVTVIANQSQAKSAAWNSDREAASHLLRASPAGNAAAWDSNGVSVDHVVSPEREAEEEEEENEEAVVAEDEDAATRMTGEMMLEEVGVDKSVVAAAAAGGGYGRRGRPGRPSQHTAVTPAAPLRLTKAHGRAVGFLIREIVSYLKAPRNLDLLSKTDPAVLLQVLELARSSGYTMLVRKLTFHMLKTMVAERTRGVNTLMFPKRQRVFPRDAGADADAAVAPASNELARTWALTRVGQKLLRWMPLPQWRELFYRHLAYREYSPFMRELFYVRQQASESRLKYSFGLGAAQAGRWGSSDAAPTDVAPLGVMKDAWGEVIENGGFVVSTASGRNVHTATSLFFLLSALQASSVDLLVRDVMSPTVLWTVTADLIWQHWWSSWDEENENDTLHLRRNGDDAREGVLAEKKVDVRVSADLPPAVTSLSSYELLMHYAAANSVLRLPTLQPFLKASLELLDKMASEDPADFIGVLTQDARWRREMRTHETPLQREVTATQEHTHTNASTLELQRGTGAQVANDGRSGLESVRASAATNAPAQPQKGVDAEKRENTSVSNFTFRDREARSTATLPASRDLGRSEQEQRDHPAAQKDPSMQLRETTNTSTAAAAQATEISPSAPTPHEPVLLLDWQPIVRFLQMLYRADQRVAEVLVREAWWPQTRSLRRNTWETDGSSASPEFSHCAKSCSDGLARRDDRRDVFHGGVEAMVRRVCVVWQSATAAEATTSSVAQQINDGREADAVVTTSSSTPPRLLVMNVHMVLDLYSPFMLTEERDDENTTERHHTTAELHGGSGNRQTTHIDSQRQNKRDTEAEVVVDASISMQDGDRSASPVPAAAAAAVVLHNDAASNWLNTSGFMSVNETSGSAADGEAYLESQLLPFAWTLRSSRDRRPRVKRARNTWSVSRSCQLRRMRLFQQAGVVMSAQDAAVLCDGLSNRDFAGANRHHRDSASTSERDGGCEEQGGVAYSADPWSDGRMNAFWTTKQSCLRQCLLDSVFSERKPTMPRSVHEASSSDTGAPRGVRDSAHDAAATAAFTQLSTSESELQRQARGRLELMRCVDVAQLLGLLLTQFPGALQGKDKERNGEDASPGNVELAQMRVLIEALSELLPTASQLEVMRVTHALLQLYVHALPCPSDEHATTATALRLAAFEIRRLLSSIGVLVANDTERFTRLQLVWLLSRLHTPQLRGLPGDGASDNALTTDMTLDVSESFLSAAVARSISAALNASVQEEDSAPALYSAEGLSMEVGEAAATTAGRTGASRVTVGRWLTAVAVAERYAHDAELLAVLSLIEATAL